MKCEGCECKLSEYFVDFLLNAGADWNVVVLQGDLYCLVLLREGWGRHAVIVSCLLHFIIIIDIILIWLRA